MSRPFQILGTANKSQGADLTCIMAAIATTLNAFPLANIDMQNCDCAHIESILNRFAASVNSETRIQVAREIDISALTRAQESLEYYALSKSEFIATNVPPGIWPVTDRRTEGYFSQSDDRKIVYILESIMTGNVTVGPLPRGVTMLGMVDGQKIRILPYKDYYLGINDGELIRVVSPILHNGSWFVGPSDDPMETSASLSPIFGCTDGTNFMQHEIFMAYTKAKRDYMLDSSDYSIVALHSINHITTKIGDALNKIIQSAIPKLASTEDDTDETRGALTRGSSLEIVTQIVQEGLVISLIAELLFLCDQDILKSKYAKYFEEPKDRRSSTLVQTSVQTVVQTLVQPSGNVHGPVFGPDSRYEYESHIPLGFERPDSHQFSLEPLGMPQAQPQAQQRDPLFDAYENIALTLNRKRFKFALPTPLHHVEIQAKDRSYNPTDVRGDLRELQKIYVYLKSRYPRGIALLENDGVYDEISSIASEVSVTYFNKKYKPANHEMPVFKLTLLQSGRWTCAVDNILTNKHAGYYRVMAQNMTRRFNNESV